MEKKEGGTFAATSLPPFKESKTYLQHRNS